MRLRSSSCAFKSCRESSVASSRGGSRREGACAALGDMAHHFAHLHECNAALPAQCRSERSKREITSPSQQVQRYVHLSSCCWMSLAAQGCPAAVPLGLRPPAPILKKY